MFRPRKWDLLVALYIFCIAVSELMGGKTFPIGQLGFLTFNASVAIFVLPLAFAIVDAVTEVAGKERARSVVVSGLVVIGCILVFSVVAVALPPSRFFSPNEKAYETIFAQSARIAFASLVAFAISELTDVSLFAKLKEKMQGRQLWLRNNLSTFISTFIDTVVFITLAFYALGKPFGANALFLWSLILPYWILKCCMSVIETPFVYVAVRWLRSGETVSTGDGAAKAVAKTSAE